MTQIEELRTVIDEVAKLMTTPVRQDKAIELWETMWTRLVPVVGHRARDLGEYIDSRSEALTQEEEQEVAEVLVTLGKTLDTLSSDNAPDPQMISLWYLRRMHNTLEEIEDRLSALEERV